MRFRSHQCWFPKDVDLPSDYEDASARSEKHGRAVIADGVSSAIFSRTWARLLTRSAVAEPPDFASEDAIQNWLVPLQEEWRKGINFAALPWHQKPKAVSVGAQTTFLTVTIEPVPPEGESLEEYRLRASGIGDCVLFLVRDGKKEFSFPLTHSDEFSEPPHIFSSIAKGVTYADKFQHLDDRCRLGDLLVLCSDAIGLWAMEEYEAGRTVDWMRYWENDEDWQADIQTLRAKRADEEGNRMRVDDCTLLLMEVVAEEPIEAEQEIQPDRSDEPFTLHASLVENSGMIMPAEISPSEPPLPEARGDDLVDLRKTSDAAALGTGDQSPDGTQSDTVAGEVSSLADDMGSLSPKACSEDEPAAASHDSDGRADADHSVKPASTFSHPIDELLDYFFGRHKNL